MLYWLVLVFLLVLILVTTVLTIISIVKEQKEYKRERYQIDEDRGAKERPVRKTRPREPERRVQEVPQERIKQRPQREEAPSLEEKKQRRWKIIFENVSTGDVYDFIFTGSVGIGRTTQDAAFEKFLSLSEDKKISKVHCSIECEKNSLYLRDEGSKNHTYLNGKRVQRPILIQKEDIISIGETDLEIVKILREAK